MVKCFKEFWEAFCTMNDLNGFMDVVKNVHSRSFHYERFLQRMNAIKITSGHNA